MNTIIHLLKKSIFKISYFRKKVETSNTRRLHASLTEIGVGTYGANNFVIHAWDKSTRIKVGKFCSIAENVHIFLGGNHDTRKITTFPFGTGSDLVGFREGHPLSNGDIIIGNDVWIGSNVSILSGVHIGDGAVIGAFSHVVRDVKPYEIVGGNPAGHIKFRFHDQEISRLLEIKWWDWPLSKILSNRDLLTSLADNRSVELLQKLKD